MQYTDMELPETIQQALAAMGFTTPTPIQAAAIPPVMTGRDLIGCAQTGTGKTAAFAIPMITKLLADETANGLVLVPTRELAVQVQEVINDLTKFTPTVRTVLLIGGVPLGGQVARLRQGPRIVVATPGRLCDHLRQGTIRLRGVNVLVLDEADRMLDMGFAPQLREIMQHLPEKRQTLLFSATFPKEIEALVGKLTKNAERVSIGERSAPNAKIRHRVVMVESRGKNDKLLEEVNAKEGLVLVFARTKHRTDKVANFLEDYGVKAARIHGNRSQSQRQKAIEDFRSGKARVLCATDIAARGIDIPEIELVINYDIPDCAEDYIHRIGRTARAGLSGEAMAILISEDKQQWKVISKLLRDKVEGSVDPQKVLTAAPMAADNAEDEGEEGVEGVNAPAPRRERSRPERRPPSRPQAQKFQRRFGSGGNGENRAATGNRGGRPGYGRQQGVRPNGTSQSGEGHQRWNRDRAPQKNKPREFDRPLI